MYSYSTFAFRESSVFNVDGASCLSSQPLYSPRPIPPCLLPSPSQQAVFFMLIHVCVSEGIQLIKQYRTIICVGGWGLDLELVPGRAQYLCSYRKVLQVMLSFVKVIESHWNSFTSQYLLCTHASPISLY